MRAWITVIFLAVFASAGAQANSITIGHFQYLGTDPQGVSGFKVILNTTGVTASALMLKDLRLTENGTAENAAAITTPTAILFLGGPGFRLPACPCESLQIQLFFPTTEKVFRSERNRRKRRSHYHSDCDPIPGRTRFPAARLSLRVIADSVVFSHDREGVHLATGGRRLFHDSFDPQIFLAAIAWAEVSIAGSVGFGRPYVCARAGYLGAIQWRLGCGRVLSAALEPAPGGPWASSGSANSLPENPGSRIPYYHWLWVCRLSLVAVETSRLHSLTRCSVCSGQLGACEGILREAKGRAGKLKNCRHWSARAKGGMASTG